MQRLVKRIVHGVALSGVMFIAACQLGTRPQKLRPAIGPQGAIVAIRLRGERADRTGEIYAADSVGLIIDLGTVVRVRWARIAALDVDQLGGEYDLANGQSVTPEKIARLTLVSRFPQGLREQLLRDVLRIRGQTEIKELP